MKVGIGGVRRHDLVAPLEYMPLPSAGAVPALAENVEQPLHAGDQIRLRCLTQEVEAIAHTGILSISRSTMAYVSPARCV